MSFNYGNHEITVEADGKQIYVGENGQYEEVVEVEETVRKVVTIVSDVQMTHDEAVDLVERYYDKGEIVVNGDDVVINIEVK